MLENITRRVLNGKNEDKSNVTEHIFISNLINDGVKFVLLRLEGRVSMIFPGRKRNANPSPITDDNSVVTAAVKTVKV